MLLFQIVPCSIEEKIKELEEKWLVAKTSCGHLFDFALLKFESKTLLCGPFWKSFLAYHNIEVGDVVTLKCFEVDEMEAQNPHNASPAKVFVTVSDSVGNNKPYIPLDGIIFLLCLFFNVIIHYFYYMFFGLVTYK